MSQRPKPERPRSTPRRTGGVPGAAGPARRTEPPPYERGDAFDLRWETLAARGVDVHGEANLLDMLLQERGGRRVLDAGCGTGRVAIELHGRGFDVVGIDIDPTMLDAARRKAPEQRWVLADLAGLSAVDLGEPFDAVLLAGNVMVYVGRGTEREVLASVAQHLVPGGIVVAGFRLDANGYSLSDYDADAEAANFMLTHRYATWERDPFQDNDYAVSVHTLR